MMKCINCGQKSYAFVDGNVCIKCAKKAERMEMLVPCSKPIRITGLHTGRVMEFPSKRAAAKAIGVNECTVNKYVGKVCGKTWKIEQISREEFVNG